MAERKNSTSPSINSKGGAVVFAKQVQRKFSRAQEKVLQKFGRSEETRDEQFEIFVQNLEDQQSDGHRIYKDLKAYLNAVKVMRDASSRLFQSLFDAYELDWEGGDDLGAVVEGEDLLWNDYETKLRDQALVTMESYMSQFPDMRERVAKRGRKCVDYDSSRHHFEALENGKKRDDIKISKAKEEMVTARKIFEDMNQELKEELPVLYDSRIGCYVTVFHAISNLRNIFYREMAQNNDNLQNIMKDLKDQHPDTNFVIKNFNRSGSLKRRSLKDALSPRSLRASFSDFHMSYSPRGTLRREYNSSFRSERGSHGSYSPVTSPTKPKVNEHPTPGAKTQDTDTSSISEDSSTPLVTDSKSAHSVTKEDVVLNNEGTEKKKGESQKVADQDRERKSLGVKGDSSPEDDEDSVLEPNVSHSERAYANASYTLEAYEDHSNHPEDLKESSSAGVENGITAESMDNTEFGASCKDTTRTDNKLDDVKEETV
ncbi:bridging integrator 2a isoform X2 [Salminus brasiliensis]|uniref:bridging integrator 2a isoform X2 n=1 Tax=Salminus brasiliensis TaxID=930266 RepID=UPI003B835D6C